MELDLETTNFELTGVDLDEHALEHRRSVTRDLDVGIVGTIWIAYRTVRAISISYIQPTS